MTCFYYLLLGVTSVACDEFDEDTVEVETVADRQRRQEERMNFKFV